MKLMELANFFIGTDIVEVKRIHKLLLKTGKLFKNKVFTALEQKYCDSKSIPAIHYAGRFSDASLNNCDERIVCFFGPTFDSFDD